MTEYNFRLANTCSTCKWSRFGAGDYRWGGKKQGGVCTRLQEEVVRPKYLRFDYVYKRDRNKMTTAGVAAYVAEIARVINKEIERLTPDMIRARWQKTQDEYAQRGIHLENNLEKSLKWAAERTRKLYRLLERLPELETNLYEWAAYNEKLAAVKKAGDGFLVHRQTVCDFWEEGPGQRESVAKKIVGEHNAN